MEIKNKIEKREVVISIIGLGYVGLPLAVEFGKQFKVIGFDINKERINELQKGNDRTLEVSSDELKEATKLTFTDNIEAIREAQIYIVTVPTPVDEYKIPDLTPLIKSSETVGKVIKKGDIVIYESTVYPGCTEDDCIPIIEQKSGLTFNKDFFAGYSPERINPGDKEHRVSTIKKVTSGSTPEIGEIVDTLYKTVIKAGTHLATCIKVAEAAKVIENAQRDINIGFVNELAKLFDLMNIDTLEVLEAAGTKWNFLPYRPGLVGGHCIGVDPYYLTHKALKLGYNPEIILAGRRINDGMGAYVANQLIKLMIKNEKKIFGSNILVLGITFKENCPDIRNSKVIDIINELIDYSCNIDVYDPWADKHEVKEEYNIEIKETLTQSELGNYDGVILAVAHDKFKEIDIEKVSSNGTVIYDVKCILPKSIVNGRL